MVRREETATAGPKVRGVAWKVRGLRQEQAERRRTAKKAGPIVIRYNHLKGAEILHRPKGLQKYSLRSTVPFNSGTFLLPFVYRAVFRPRLCTCGNGLGTIGNASPIHPARFAVHPGIASKAWPATGPLAIALAFRTRRGRCVDLHSSCGDTAGTTNIPENPAGSQPLDLRSSHPPDGQIWER